MYHCTLEINGKSCDMKFDSRRKLKDHLVPAPHSAMRVLCPFCIAKETTFSRPGDLRGHVSRHHKSATYSADIPIEDLFSENNCFWLAFQPSVYRSLVEPTDRNSHPASRLRSLLLEWTRKISFTPKRSRQSWLDGWDSKATNFKPVRPSEYNPGSPSLYSIASISLVPHDICAILEDEQTTFHLRLEDGVLLDPKSIASLSRKMAVLQPEPLPPLSSFTSADIKKERMNHFATSLGIDSRFIRAVSKLSKHQDYTEPELELFAESDIESMPSPGTVLHRRTPSPVQEKEPQKKRIRVEEYRSVRLPSLTSATPVSTSGSRPPAPAPLENQATTPREDAFVPAPSPDHSLCPLASRAKKLLAYGCMPLLPPARRQWEKEEVVVLTSGGVTIPWPPKDFAAMSKDKRLLELEYTAMTLKRSLPGGLDVERASLLDEFNFLALPGTLCLSPRKLSPPRVKSRVYLYQAVRNIAMGRASSLEDEAVIAFLEGGGDNRINRWDHLIRSIDNAGIPLRLSD